MNYFKNTNNEIFAYDDKQVKQGYGKDLTPITEQEKDLIFAPTAEELEDIRINTINNKARDIIYSRYPQEKQSSASLSIYGEEYLTTMKLFIKQVIDISNEAIDNGTPAEDVDFSNES